ncbi:MAG: GNAT family protein [Gammaproteobacteria bacterium]|nr:GNAT family protein [Gammaproteobacteria bacterium]
MITFQKIGFRPIEYADIETLRLIRNDASTILNLGTVELTAPQDQESWWKNLSNSKNAKRFSIIELETQEVIGMIRVQHIEPVNRNCEIGLDIAKAMRGKGFGYMSYRALLSYLFDHYNMNMVYLRYIPTNTVAARLYDSLGFKETGYLKDFIYRDGKFMDYKIMCLTKNEYQEQEK